MLQSLKIANVSQRDDDCQSLDYQQTKELLVKSALQRAGVSLHQQPKETQGRGCNKQICVINRRGH